MKSVLHVTWPLVVYFRVPELSKKNLVSLTYLHILHCPHLNVPGGKDGVREVCTNMSLRFIGLR